jgi:hypothetical protein
MSLSKPEGMTKRKSLAEKSLEKSMTPIVRYFFPFSESNFFKFYIPVQAMALYKDCRSHGATCSAGRGVPNWHSTKLVRPPALKIEQLRERLERTAEWMRQRQNP